MIIQPKYYFKTKCKQIQNAKTNKDAKSPKAKYDAETKPPVNGVASGSTVA